MFVFSEVLVLTRTSNTCTRTNTLYPRGIKYIHMHTSSAKPLKRGEPQDSQGQVVGEKRWRSVRETQDGHDAPLVPRVEQPLPPLSPGRDR